MKQNNSYCLISNIKNTIFTPNIKIHSMPVSEKPVLKFGFSGVFGFYSLKINVIAINIK